MRGLGVVGAVVAMASGVHAERPAPAPVAALATPGALYLINPAGVRARCDRWEVRPGVGGAGALVRTRDVDGQREVDVIEYRAAGARLTLTGRQQRTAASDESMTCALDLPVAASRDGLAVGGGQWFADAAACARAVAQRRPVVPDLSSCEFAPRVPVAIQRATQRAFAQLLTDGGTAYTDHDGRCLAFEVVAARPQPGRLLRGTMRRDITVHGVRGWQSTAYLFVPGAHVDELTLMGSSAGFDDGTGYGIGVSHAAYLRYGDGVVEATRAIYLSRPACAAAIAAAARRDAWSPAAIERDEGGRGERDAADAREAPIGEPRADEAWESTDADARDQATTPGGLP